MTNENETIEPLSWKEVFFSNTKLKDLREEYKLDIPEWYLETDKRFKLFIMLLMFLVGVFTGRVI